MNRHELLKFHSEICTAALKLMEKKNHDYAGGSGESPFANFTRCESMGICTTEQGFLVRLTDKISRLSTFCEAGQLLVKGESVRDTCEDVINYAILFAAFISTKSTGGGMTNEKTETTPTVDAPQRSLCSSNMGAGG